MAKIAITDLLEAGVHFGHQTKRWNPKMKDFVYGTKNGIFIIDLTKTMHQLADSINFLQRVVTDGGRVLFVGTKRQAQSIVKEAAEKTDMFFVSERWLGGTLTNNFTIRNSVKRMDGIDEQLESDEISSLKKKEVSSLRRKSMRLHRNLDGIYKMKNLPAALVVVDIINEETAIREANKLKIPVVALVDTNGNPENIDYPIPANDDAVRSIKIIIDVISDAIGVAAEIYNKRAAEERAIKAAKQAEEKAAREKAEKEKAAKEKEKAEKDKMIKEKIAKERAKEKAAKEKEKASREKEKTEKKTESKKSGKSGEKEKSDEKKPEDKTENKVEKTTAQKEEKPKDKKKSADKNKTSGEDDKKAGKSKETKKTTAKKSTKSTKESGTKAKKETKDTDEKKSKPTKEKKAGEDKKESTAKSAKSKKDSAKETDKKEEKK